MDDSGLRLDLISGLAEAFQEPGPQKQEGSRFNKATGTLIVSNTFINYALSHIDGDGFTKGKVYKCSQIENDFTRIISDDGKEIRVNINDPDFSFKINPLFQLILHHLSSSFISVSVFAYSRCRNEIHLI